jgi:hypothetical protein
LSFLWSVVLSLQGNRALLLMRVIMHLLFFSPCRNPFNLIHSIK